MQMYQAYTDMPDAPNHWLLAAFMNLTIIQSYVYLIFKRKSFYIDKAELLNTFAPLVNIQLIILYFFAVFHKLNADFFNTEASCAVRFLILQNNYYNILPPDKIFLTINIYLTVFIEALIPLLLIFRRSRNWGILLGLVFHCILAYNPLNGFYDFSATVFALYLLFTSTSFSNQIYQLYQKFKRQKTALKRKLLQFKLRNLFFFAGSVGLLVALVHYYNREFEDYFRHLVWTGYSVSFIVIFMLAMRSGDASEKPKAFSFAHFSLMIIPVIVFVNGLCPYLGLKTESSYAMFSNLRTEGGITNHFIVPASTQIFDYQKDVIEIVSSSDPFLQRMAQEQKLLVYFQFRRYVRKSRVQQVSYKRNGVPATFDRSKASANDPMLRKENGMLEKIMQFRYFYKDGTQLCLH
ncbi:HTTM domain-containing protein [Sabulibacter ruber]|uniref:HTTM domain-containing protein n=1 Tax=Sabulibacter ruber TaxID=2811901 RepID=UPI001A977567|nr:HTTM domain-containing protein [Sabulibacter ruber]